MPVRDDYILRMISQAAAAIRRLRELLTKRASADEVVMEAHGAIGQLLGPQRTMLEMLDARSAATLLGDPERVQLWATLMRIQADAERSRGPEGVDSAARLEQRAAELEAAVQAGSPGAGQAVPRDE